MTRFLAVDDRRLLSDLAHTPAAREDAVLRVAATRAGLVTAARESVPDVVLLSDSEGCPEPCASARSLRAARLDPPPVLVFVGAYVSRESGRRAGIDLFVPRHAGRAVLAEALARAVRVGGRRARRWSVDLPVGPGEGDDARAARCLDLSVSGCFIVPREPGETLPVSGGLIGLDLGDRTLSVPAERIRTGPGRGGRVGTAYAFRPRSALEAGSLSRAVREAAERRGRAPGGAS